MVEMNSGTKKPFGKGLHNWVKEELLSEKGDRTVGVKNLELFYTYSE